MQGDGEYLNSIPGMVDSILAGMNTPLSECAKELVW